MSRSKSGMEEEKRIVRWRAWVMMAAWRGDDQSRIFV